MTDASGKLTAVWLVLVVVTSASWWLAESRGAGEGTVLSVMLFALFKARLVFLNFMELRVAPRAWRFAFEIWIFCSVGVIVLLEWGSRY
ncbi:cytochrome C oxidase subunit IV family protein [Zoogloea sp.]|uniref:cytochrome C oxidase subunit IV family protein n=1 Tax=Zoogloea sp. TaxID=49181 RepID=UPI0035B313D7